MNPTPKRPEQSFCLVSLYTDSRLSFPFLYRYASLYFCCAIEDQDNELITLEIIHRYVELLDKYFGSVSPSFLLQSFAPLISYCLYSSPN